MPESSPNPPLQSHLLTWAALLGHWSAMARSALLLPDDEQGRGWKASVSDLIGLQALIAALGDWDWLLPAEWALAVDRSAVSIEQHLENLHRNLGPRPWPAALEELVRDAEAALQAARKRLEPDGLQESV